MQSPNLSRTRLPHQTQQVAGSCANCTPVLAPLWRRQQLQKRSRHRGRPPLPTVVYWGCVLPDHLLWSRSSGPMRQCTSNSREEWRESVRDALWRKAVIKGKREGQESLNTSEGRVIRALSRPLVLKTSQFSKLIFLKS